MALPHAEPGELIELCPNGSSLAEQRTSTLFKTNHVEVVRLIMAAGKEIAEHKAPGELVVQCLQGKIAFTAHGKTQELRAGQLLYLAAHEPHAVTCVEAGTLLLTIVFAE